MREERERKKEMKKASNAFANIYILLQRDSFYSISIFAIGKHIRVLALMQQVRTT